MFFKTLMELRMNIKYFSWLFYAHKFCYLLDDTKSYPYILVFIRRPENQSHCRPL